MHGRTFDGSIRIFQCTIKSSIVLFFSNSLFSWRETTAISVYVSTNQLIVRSVILLQEYKTGIIH